MSSWSEAVVSGRVVSSGTRLAWKHPRFTFFTLFYTALTEYARYLLSVGGTQADIAVGQWLMLLASMVIWVGMIHVLTPSEGRDKTVLRALGYGLGRLFVSMLAIVPYVAVSTILGVLALLLFSVPTHGRPEVVAFYLALIVGLLNPWSLRLSLTLPILAAKNVPFGGVVGMTWRATRGQVSLIFTSCYLPQLLVILVMVVIRAALGGFSLKAEDQLVAGLVALPINSYMFMVSVGSFSALACHLVDAQPAVAQDDIKPE